MSLLESEAHLDERALAPLLRRLEAERERWFFWVPVFLGMGIGLYFWLPHEPSLMAALVPFAIARHPAALGDDCQHARILIASFANPKCCNGPAALIDFFDVRRGGTHAIYIEADGSIRVETVTQTRETGRGRRDALRASVRNGPQSLSSAAPVRRDVPECRLDRARRCGS